MFRVFWFHVWATFPTAAGVFRKGYARHTIRGQRLLRESCWLDGVVDVLRGIGGWIGFMRIVGILFFAQIGFLISFRSCDARVVYVVVGWHTVQYYKIGFDLREDNGRVHARVYSPIMCHLLMGGGMLEEFWDGRASGGVGQQQGGGGGECDETWVFT